jgi:hypothetical protein
MLLCVKVVKMSLFYGKWTVCYVGTKCHGKVGRKIQVKNVTDFRINYYSGLKCHTVTNISRMECHIFGWTYNPSTLSQKVSLVNWHSRRFVGVNASFGSNVAWSVRGWTDHLGTDMDMGT